MGKRKDTVSSAILSNIVLAACTIFFLCAVVYLYQKKIQTVTLTDNRFLTTEWHLLQELKAKTDQQLRDKDLEISRLRSEYRKLKQEEYSPDRLLALEAELKKAENERSVILSSRLSAVVTPPAASGLALRNPDTQAGSVAAPLPGSGADNVGAANAAGAANQLSELLGQRIQELEIQVTVNRRRAEMAEKNLVEYIKEIEARKNTGTPVEPLPAETPAVPDRDVSSKTVEAMLVLLEGKKTQIEQEPPPKIEDIRTRSLLRAIVSTPAIRKEYPDLLESLDRYFEVYGRQEWLTGQKDAYLFTIESLKTLESEKPE